MINYLALERTYPEFKEFLSNVDMFKKFSVSCEEMPPFVVISKIFESSNAIFHETMSKLKTNFPKDEKKIEENFGLLWKTKLVYAENLKNGIKSDNMMDFNIALMELRSWILSIVEPLLLDCLRMVELRRNKNEAFGIKKMLQDWIINENKYVAEEKIQWEKSRIQPSFIPNYDLKKSFTLAEKSDNTYDVLRRLFK